ncbi:hypothetical protein F0562_002803 [Nyssa sinensis]|uniref:Uncharacterized protein n=1 Tax=Nyssa sinensis TaxID=561372 RepID=A0A5J5BUJ7_9ASTE|nr:hypothetical protein F0562_002803 [Nyssa sinensis]
MASNGANKDKGVSQASIGTKSKAKYESLIPAEKKSVKKMMAEKMVKFVTSSVNQFKNKQKINRNGANKSKKVSQANTGPTSKPKNESFPAEKKSVKTMMAEKAVQSITSSVNQFTNKQKINPTDDGTD